MKIITLESTPFPAIAATFNEAFSDYTIPFNLNEECLGEMLRRRGVRPELSVGVEADGRLAGFTLNGLGVWQGEPTGYDSGTGVIPSARGRRLSALMLDRTKELLRDAGATRYLLEVIQSNAPAVRVYLESGFQQTRELLCWSLDDIAGREPNIPIAQADREDWPAFDAMRDSRPSWQNGHESIARAGDPKVILVTRDGSGFTGYLILFPAMCDVAQFAVAPRARGRGIGRALLAEARHRASGPLRILNIDARDQRTNGFLERLGAQEIVRQFEMSLRLTEENSGAPILYFHGFASSPRGRKVTRLREILSPQIRLAAPDLNAPSFERLDYEAIVERAVGASQRCKPSLIAGSSLGALVALEVCKRGAAAPLVLIAPAFGIAERWNTKLPNGDPVFVYNHAVEHDAPIHRAFFDQMTSVFVDCEPPPVPVTVVMGRKDENVPFERVEATWQSWESSGRLVPGSRFVEIPNGDHTLTDFAGVLADEIRQRLERAAR